MIKGAQALFPFVSAPESPAPSVKPNQSADPSRKRRGRPPRQNGPTTWTGIMEQILANGDKFTYDGLRAEVGKTSLANKLAKTDKSFYGAIGKLSEAGVLVKHRGWLFHKDAFEKFKRDLSAGLVEDSDAPKNNPAHHSPFGDAIKSFMDQNPGGAGSKDISDELKKTPDFADTMDRHKSHLYNVLARLVDQGELVKGGGRYYRAPNRAGIA
jgi:hypothetical protein